MPKHHRHAPARRPTQLPLFPEVVELVHIDPLRNCWRFYRLALQPDLFGGAALIRHWGRIGTPGVRRLDLYADPGAALNALAELVRVKRRHGYRARGR